MADSSSNPELNELSHYGKKGMKWGVRKGSSVSKTSKPKRLSKDHREATKIKKKHTSEMSNDELKALTKRMQLEKSYKDLNPHTMSKGKKYLAAALGTYAMINTVASIPNSPAYKVDKKVYGYATKAKSASNMLAISN